MKAIINIFGGPGAGKSVLAAELFVIFKKEGMNIELATEYAKQMVFEDRIDVLKNDQLYVLAKQHRKMLPWSNGVDYVVTDGPFAQGIMYLGDKSIYDTEAFRSLTMSLHNEYTSINIFISRGSNIPYQQCGRYQNERQADEKAAELLSFMFDNGIDFIQHTTGSDINVLVNQIKQKIEEVEKKCQSRSHHKKPVLEKLKNFQKKFLKRLMIF